MNDETVKYPDAPVINIETNYSKFSILRYNRCLTQRNVNKLIECNIDKFEMHNFPILCDKSLNIIDGQHRFEACKIKGWPVYYIVEDSIGETSWRDVNRVNNAGKLHTTTDVIMMLIKVGDEKMLKVDKLWDELTDRMLPVSILANLLHAFNSGGGGALQKLKNGQYEIRFEKETRQLFNFVNDLEIPNNIRYSGGYLYALAHTLRRSGRQFEAVFERLRMHEFMITNKRGSIAQYEYDFKAAYNRNLKRNKIS